MRRKYMVSFSDFGEMIWLPVPVVAWSSASRCWTGAAEDVVGACSDMNHQQLGSTGAEIK